MLGLAADVLAAGQTPVCEEDLFELLDGGAFEAEMGVADHPARGVVRQQVVFQVDGLPGPCDVLQEQFPFPFAGRDDLQSGRMARVFLYFAYRLWNPS